MVQTRYVCEGITGDALARLEFTAEECSAALDPDRSILFVDCDLMAVPGETHLSAHRRVGTTVGEHVCATIRPES
jgi:hypothetical protein